MGNLLSSSKSTKRKKPGEITDADRAVLSLKTQRRKLEDQSKLVEQRIEQQELVARELLAAQKRERALLALKKKKLSQAQLKSLQDWLVNVESVLSNVELSHQQNAVLGALKSGNEVLKDLQKQWTVDDVQKLMDDSAEAKALQDELYAVLSESLTEADEGAVLAELEELERVAADVEVLELPIVPTTQVGEQVLDKVPATAEAVEEELPSPPTTQVAVEEAKEQPLLAA